MKKRNLPNRLPGKKTQQSEIGVGVCWYTPESWARIKETAADSEIFENTFSEWEAMATESFDFIRTAHPGAVKVLIDADEFFAWCFLRGMTNDSSARSEFVAGKGRQRVKEVQNTRN